MWTNDGCAVDDDAMWLWPGAVASGCGYGQELWRGAVAMALLVTDPKPTVSVTAVDDAIRTQPPQLGWTSAPILFGTILFRILLASGITCANSQ